MRAIQEQEQQRQDAMTEAWAAYRGDFPVPLEEPTDGHDDTIIVNESERIVDIATAFLFGVPPKWDLPQGEDAPEDETPDEVWLKECLRVNGWDALLLDARINGGVTGTPYVKVLPADKSVGHDFPRLQLLDSSCMTVLWDPRDITRITGYVWQADTVDEDGKPIVSRQTIKQDGTGWLITDEHHSAGVGAGADWTQDKETPWGFPFPPVAHCKNLPNPNEVYGKPDLTPNLIRLNRALNFNLSNDNRVQHYQGHPILYSVGITGNVDISPDHINHLPSKDARLDQLAPELDHEAAQNSRDDLTRRIGKESSTPAIAQGELTVANPSGVALRIQFWPMDQKVGMMRTLYGPWIVEIIRRLFVLSGEGDGKIVTLTWADLLPIDKLEQRQALALELQEGLTSKETASKEIGRNFANERKNIEAERLLDPEPTVIESDKPANLLQKAETTKAPR